MKNPTLLTILISVACIAPTMCSCGDTGEDTPVIKTDVAVTVSSDYLTAGPDAATLEVSITANADWAVNTDADWITLTPSGGAKNTPTIIKASVTPNTGLDSRSALINIVSGGDVVKTLTLTQSYNMTASLSENALIYGAEEATTDITVTANTPWTLDTDADWISISPTSGDRGETNVSLKLLSNPSGATRQGVVTLKYGDKGSELKINQLSMPSGYSLVWRDEFNSGTLPGPDWTLENWAPGHVNNELQTYTSKEIDGKRTAEVKDGCLYINCFKGSDGKVYSARLNAKPNVGWLYGYFEARINLPKGKGTWPAYWMMPVNVDWGANPWPNCGEIDIMEEVGADPNHVSSSLHTGNYNHTKGNQPTHAMYLAGAEGEFHVYALEWSEDKITTYVDGEVQLETTKAQLGADHNSWPFHYAFYPILNLAWGGDWGGYKGVDPSALPVSMKVDYIRIFQKK